MAIAERWIRFGADGWRLDVPEEVDIGFWREFRERVRGVDPEAYLVGEIWRVRPHWLMGDTFDGLMDYPLTEALIGYVGGPHIDWAVVNQQDQYREAVHTLDGHGFAAELAHLLRVYDPEVVASQLNLLGSHDTARFVTVCGGDAAAFRLATLIQMTLPGAPCVYYGDEVGLEGGIDPDCRRAFPLDRALWDEERRSVVRGAVALRRANPVLRHGAVRILGSHEGAMAYLRSQSGSPPAEGAAAFVVAVNAGTRPASLKLDVPELSGRDIEPVTWAGKPAAAQDGGPVAVDGGSVSLSIPARDGVVLRVASRG
jgi:neopullulanase